MCIIFWGKSLNISPWGGHKVVLFHTHKNKLYKLSINCIQLWNKWEDTYSSLKTICRLPCRWYQKKDFDWIGITKSLVAVELLRWCKCNILLVESDLKIAITGKIPLPNAMFPSRMPFVHWTTDYIIASGLNPEVPQEFPVEQNNYFSISWICLNYTHGCRKNIELLSVAAPEKAIKVDFLLAAGKLTHFRPA